MTYALLRQSVCPKLISLKGDTKKMLKLNKEYTYKQICEELGWNVFTGGDSKKAQIKEIESVLTS